MADVTGAYTTPYPIVSQNTESVLRHRARFVASAGNLIALPLVTGLRYIIYSAITAGTYLSIGLSTNGSAILSGKTKFTFTQAAGPTDLSRFFSATPFTEYFAPTLTDVYLLLLSDGAFTISVVDYKV